MSLSLTCSCGVRLEIDDKFAGQVIYCPDCHKAIPTQAPPPRGQKTSYMALASVVLALAGALTIVVPLVAAGLGWLGLRQIRKHREKLAGQTLAQAGIVLGLGCALLGLGVYLAPNVGGLDAMFREIEWRGKLDYPQDLKVEKEFSITRPSAAWGVYRHQREGAGEHYDDLILVHPGHDANVAVMTVDLVNDREDAEAHRQRGLQRFLDSELIHLVGRFRGKAPRLQPEIRAKTQMPAEQGVEIHELVLELKLGGCARTFLVRIIKPEHQFKINVVAAGARSAQFSRIEDELRQMLDSYKAVR